MHSYTRPVNFDQLLLFQNEVHFVPFSTTSLQIKLTTCKRFFFLLFYLVALYFIRMLADYNLIQLSVYIKKKVHKDDQ